MRRRVFGIFGYDGGGWFHDDADNKHRTRFDTIEEAVQYCKGEDYESSVPRPFYLKSKTSKKDAVIAAARELAKVCGTQHNLWRALSDALQELDGDK